MIKINKQLYLVSRYKNMSKILIAVHLHKVFYCHCFCGVFQCSLLENKMNIKQAFAALGFKSSDASLSPMTKKPSVKTETLGLSWHNKDAYEASIVAAYAAKKAASYPEVAKSLNTSYKARGHFGHNLLVGIIANAAACKGGKEDRILKSVGITVKSARSLLANAKSGTFSSKYAQQCATWIEVLNNARAKREAEADARLSFYQARAIKREAWLERKFAQLQGLAAEKASKAADKLLSAAIKAGRAAKVALKVTWAVIVK